MKPLSFLPRGLAVFLLAATPVLRADSPPAAPVSAQPVLSATGTAQQGVLDHSQAVNGSIGDLVEEMKLNGMSTAQITKILQAADHLGTINDQNLPKVIALMKSVPTLQQDSDQQAALLNAYQQQKGISTELKTVSVELAREANTQAAIQKLQALILRQAANLRATQKLRDATPPGALPTAEQQRQISRAALEQQAISKDTSLMSHALVNPPPDGTVPTPPPADATALDNLSKEAARQTSERNLAAASIDQGLLKDKLAQTLADLQAKQDDETRIDQARKQVDQLLQEQKNLAPMDNRGPRGPTLADHQAKIADETDLTADIAKLNPQAAAQIAQARTDMQQNADAVANSQNHSSELPAQAGAVDALTKAAQLLAQQAKEAQDKNNESLADAQKDLQKLKNDIDQTNQEADQKPADAAKDIAQLQKEADPLSPDAAKKLNDAASQLQPSQMHPDKASQDMADASKSVQNQLDAIAQPAQDAAMLAKASSDLDEAVAKAKDASASLQDAAHPDQAKVSADLARTQSILHDLDSQPAIAAAAHAPLAAASAKFDAGQSASAQGKGSDAKKNVDAGVGVLEAAQQKLATMMAQVQEKGMAALGKKNGRQMAHDNHGLDDKDPNGGENVITGTGNLHATGAQVVGALAPKDRDALVQSESEKVPTEYAPMVQQYMKNLSDSSPQ